MPRWVQIILLLVSAGAFVYEFWALLSGAPLITTMLRNLGKSYCPVYWFGGMVTGFLIVVLLYGSGLPGPIRIAVLSWIATSAHIFWQDCV